MSELLFRQDAYAREASGRVTGVTPEGGIVLDGSLFYPTGGGQPGDSGRLEWEGGSLPVASTIKGAGDDIVLVPSEPDPVPPVGAQLRQVLDWDRRYRHMRVHTLLHLLSVVIPLPVTGGSISARKGRLDFAMPDGAPDKETLEAALMRLIERDLPVAEGWITREELAARPELVKTMSVAPPAGQGPVRLVRIGAGEDQVDLQPCGGTHVLRTAEIGAIRIGKIENKGAQNRRVNVLLEN